jgi:hypothetical protein
LNPRLRLKLLRGDAQQRATPATPPAIKLGTLHLLGEGLDAILQATYEPPYWWWERLFYPNGISDPRRPKPPTPEQRLARYYTAAAMHPLYRDFSMACQREVLGSQFREAWRDGKRPNFRRIRGLMPIPARALKVVRA